MKTPEHYQHLNEHQEKSIAIQYVKHHSICKTSSITNYDANSISIG